MEYKFAEGYQSGSAVCFTQDGHTFYFNYSSNGTEYYQCTQYSGQWCLGKGLIRDGAEEFIQTSGHNHYPTPYEFLLRHLRERILQQSSLFSWVRPSQIVRDAILEANQRLGIPRNVTAHLTYNWLRSAIWRRRMERFPPLPPTLEELGARLLDFADLTQTLDMQDNIFGGSFGEEINETKCLIFMSQRMSSFMKRVDEVFVDGTFSVRFPVPANRQVYSFVTNWDNHVIPLCWIIMQSKNQGCYEAAFRGVRELCPQFNPTIVHCDFERAQMNALHVVFIGCTVYGCYFHYVDDILKKAVVLGLKVIVDEDNAADSLLRSFTALPLLPSNLITTGMLALAEEAIQLNLMDDFADFFHYVHTQWMPLAEDLSVFRAVHRTNNCCEAHNRMIGREVGRIHPMAYDLLGAFVRMEENAVQDLYSIYNGNQPSRNRKTSAIHNDLFIRNHTNHLVRGEITILHFLHLTSRRIQNVYDRRLRREQE